MAAQRQNDHDIAIYGYFSASVRHVPNNGMLGVSIKLTCLTSSSILAPEREG
jgi:hypothetical protein